MTPAPAMIVDGLTKDYSYFEKNEGLRGSLQALFHRKILTRRAVDHFFFSLEAGGILGLMGPNGAGKTTLIKMLTGIIRPTAGSARVLGFDPSRPTDAYKKQYALVMGQKSQLWWDLPAVDTFQLNKAIYEIPEPVFRRNLELYSEMFSVGDLLKVPVRQLSLGERMKMELIAALLHRPRVLFLDEPTIGLDVVSQKAVRQFLRDYNKRHRVTILLTSHYMADIKELCDRVIVIHKGTKIYDGALARLENSGGARKKIIKFRPVESTFPALVELAEDKASVSPDGEVTLHVPVDQVVAVSQRILAAGPVADITIEDVPLEDVIAELFTSKS